MAKKSNKLSMNLINAILYIVVGILFCIFRAGVLNWLLTVVAIVFIVYGVLYILAGSLVNGIIAIVIGAVILVCGWTVVTIALIVFGVLLAIQGVLNLVQSLKGKLNLGLLISSCITIFIGVLLIISKWVLVDWFFIVLGVVFIIDGVLALIKK